MLESVHRLGSKIRHSPLLRRQTWLWQRVEPVWQAAFARASKDRGFETRINGDIFRLDYSLGARYNREDNITFVLYGGEARRPGGRTPSHYYKTRYGDQKF